MLGACVTMSLVGGVIYYDPFEEYLSEHKGLMNNRASLQLRLYLHFRIFVQFWVPR